MKKLDHWAMELKGIPPLLLMENAGIRVTQKAREILKNNVRGKSIVLLVGKGNNGGDAMVAARHLYQLGADVKLFLLFSPDNFQGSTLDNWELIKGEQLKWNYLDDENSFYLLKLSLNQCDLVVDGIFGTGFHGNPQEKSARAINIVNDSSSLVLSIDIPSGLDADSGRVGEPCLRADYVITFAWVKRGMVLFPGRKMVGQWNVVDISLPGDILELLETKEYYVTDSLAGRLIPPVDQESFKNTFGHVIVIAGSPGMMGAAYLACRGALRVGAGLVTSCVPTSLADSFDMAFPEVMTRGFAETQERTLASLAWGDIEQLLMNKNSVVFGPGLSTHPSIRDILIKLLENSELPLVIDADGLNVLASDTTILTRRTAPVVLTPHPGEMGRLLGISTEEVQADRVGTVSQAADRFQSVVVLKGAATIIGEPGGGIFVNSSGGPALATAGSGDVLAGVIGGLLAQGLNTLEAAVLGVYIHGRAGDKLAGEMGQRGVIAGDIAETIPRALEDLRIINNEQ